jgi:hypothetical protein
LPGGHSYGFVTVDADGSVSLDMHLSDNTTFTTQPVSLSKDGVWPLYAPLYSNKGLVLSWVNFEDTATNNLSGAATWIRTSSAGPDPYSAGFTNDFQITGSFYQEPVLGFPIINLSSGSIILSGGDLTGAITNSFTLDTSSVATVDPSATDGVTLTFDLSNGTFGGNFNDVPMGGVNVFNGVVLQSASQAFGYFTGPTNSGAVLVK